MKSKTGSGQAHKSLQKVVLGQTGHFVDEKTVFIPECRRVGVEPLGGSGISSATSVIAPVTRSHDEAITLGALVPGD